MSPLTQFFSSEIYSDRLLNLNKSSVGLIWIGASHDMSVLTEDIMFKGVIGHCSLIKTCAVFEVPCA